MIGNDELKLVESPLPGIVRNFSMSAFCDRHVAHVVYSMRLTLHKKLNILKYLKRQFVVKILN